jgi:single-strand DNA-binding protein
MGNINTVTVSGNLTRDPELRSTKNGTSVASFGIAVNRRFKNEAAEGGYEEEVSFFDITVWSGFGELTAAKLRKGDSATVQGRLKQNRWETDEGEKRSRIEIIADQIDSDGYFRSKDENNDTTAAPAAVQGTLEATVAATTDDDIPF